MTAMGWVFMIVSWGTLSFLTGWCIVQILRPTSRQSMGPDEVPHTN